MRKLSLFRKQGFTIIELLVVVAIISVLASIVFVNVNSIRQKAKRTAALQSFSEISKAMYMYSIEHGEFLQVPGKFGYKYWYGEGNPPDFVINETHPDGTYPNWDATYYCSDCAYGLDLMDNDGDKIIGTAFIYIYNPDFTLYIRKNILCEDYAISCGSYYYFPL